MTEADLYQPVRQKLEELFTSKGKPISLEVTAAKGLSEKLKQELPQHREITFAFLRKRPDLFGFIDGQYTSSLITVEVKQRIENIDDIYQAKLYKDVFGARYGFLITTAPIPEEIYLTSFRNFLLSSSPLTHFISTTFRGMIYTRWCCIDRLNWHRIFGS